MAEARGSRCRFLADEWVRLGPSHVLLHSSVTGARAVVDVADLEFLRRCLAFLPLEEHADRVRRALGWGVEQLPHVRARLEARAAFFVRPEQVLLRPPEAEAPPISTLAVVTHRRPEALSRCLAAQVPSARPGLRLLVADGADHEDPDVVSRARGADAWYVGPRQRQDIAAALVRQGALDPDLASFALLDRAGGVAAPGLNRNAVLLDTLGERFVSVDDDTVGAPALPGREAGGAVRVSSRADPTEFHFFSDRLAALGALPADGVDVLAPHDAALGRLAADLAGEAPELGEADDELLRGLARGQARVRLTQAGVRGDSGMGTPFALLWLEGGSRERLLAAVPEAAALANARHVVRSAARTTVGNGILFMAYAAGFDHRELLPPFLPLFRGEDDSFLAVLRRIHPGTCVAHLSTTIVHDPPGVRAFPAVGDRAATGLRQPGVLLRAFMDQVPLPGGWDAARRLRALGRHLDELGSLDPEEFRTQAEGAFARTASRWIDGLENIRRDFRGAPSWWIGAVDRALAGLRLAASPGDGPFLDIEDLPERDVGSARALLRRFGRLMAAWPEVCEAVRDLRARGRRLSIRMPAP